MDGDQKPPLTAEFLPQVRGCGRTRAVPWRALALSRSPPGPSAGQLAHGVLCRRISSGAHTAVLIRHTGVAFETGRAGRFPGKGWGGKDTHSCCPRVRLYPPALIPAVIPLHNRRSVGGPGGPLPPRLTPRLGPAPAPAAPLHNWMPSPGRGRRAMGAAGAGGPASCGVSVSH